MKYFLMAITMAISANLLLAESFVTISGKVTDYNNQPVDSCNVSLCNSDFSTLYETLTDKNGEYKLDSIPEGRYAALYAVRLKDYPRAQMVPEEDMKLEFWAWNIIADKDITLDIRYDKLELYGTKAFFEYGGRRELLIYTRPMSVTKAIAYQNFQDKNDSEINGPKVTVDPQFMEFEVYCDGSPLNIYSVQNLSLLHINGVQDNKGTDDCYLIQAEIPSDIYNNRDKPYEIRIVGHNKEFDEWGENVYYLEPPHYVNEKRQD